MRWLEPSLVCIILATAPSAFGRPEHNAFLNSPVASTDQLIKQLHRDPQVLKRYERHFMMSEPTLVHYFKGLHVEPLTHDKKYLVFNVDDAFSIKHRLLHLKKGTLVFADSSHKPILKRSCGNPMVAYLPALGESAQKMHSAGGSGTPVSTRSASNPGSLDALSQDDSSTLNAMVPPIPADALVADEGVPVGSALVITPSPASPLVGTGPVDAITGLGGGGSLGFLALAGIIGGVALNHGGGGGGGVIPATTPEPAAYIPFGIGLAGMGLLRRRARK